MNGKDILALGWPAGKVIGLGLAAAGALESTVGLGAEDSLNSASHGAGRRMSRTRAFKELDGTAWRENLRKKGITLLGGALDEAPAAYKDIGGVMDAQADLVEAIGEFSPSIVRMDAGSKNNRHSRKSGRRASR